jgi:hypothetical protein
MLGHGSAAASIGKRVLPRCMPATRPPTDACVVTKMDEQCDERVSACEARTRRASICKAVTGPSTTEYREPSISANARCVRSSASAEHSVMRRARWHSKRSAIACLRRP